MEEEAKGTVKEGRVSERILLLWQRKWLGWRLFVFMQVRFLFFIFP